MVSITTLALSGNGFCQQSVVQSDYNEERAGKALSEEFFKGSFYEAYQPIAAVNIFFGAGSGEVSVQTGRTIEYRLKTNSTRDKWLLKCMSTSDTVTIGTAEQIPNTELFRNKIVYMGEDYTVEYGGFRFIFDNNREVLGTYIPNDAGVIGERENRLDFKIIQNKRSAGFRFTDATSDEVLLSAQHMKRASDDYLVIQVQTDRQTEIINLIAVLVFSEMWIKK